MTRPVVLSLCDLTGNFTHPWVEAGYEAVLVDPQHGVNSWDGPVTRLAMTVEEALPHLGPMLHRVAFVAGWPPCTDMAVSGARWFAAKREADPMFQAKAVAVAEQCRTVGQLSGSPWLVENPVSVLARVFGKPDHTFHPADYTALEPGDNYTKRTCLWTGGGFVMPPPQRDPELGPPDDRIHKAPPSARRANIRSATPNGVRAGRVPGEWAAARGGGRMTDAPCSTCHFVPTGGPCLCRVPTDDDVPLWGEADG